MVLQETQYNLGDKFRIPNYTTYRNDRLTHMGDVSAHLIKNSIDQHLSPIPTSTFENTTVSIDFPNNKSLTISSIYRPPPHGRSNTQDLNNVFNFTPKEIAVWNFNAKHPAWSESRANINGTIIHNDIANNNLVLAPLELTHFPYHHLSNNTIVSLMLCTTCNAVIHELIFFADKNRHSSFGAAQPNLVQRTGGRVMSLGQECRGIETRFHQ
ncbi:hypothetical protein AVEN_817-1 [Araneus ventricosus]|uniref:Endonuclease/exonuclease/phosphatase domain-containing protein n=1 Tax=Araneus ventricosus TaxID=182803 RepID=A0A4Y2K7Z0_ARAVE|nr:hypothetical protein AVEN_817-1 [Araneus ventricosus]